MAAAVNDGGGGHDIELNCDCGCVSESNCFVFWG